MKKRILILCLAGVFVFSLSACGRQAAEETQSAGNAANEQKEEVQTAQKPEAEQSSANEKETEIKEDTEDKAETQKTDQEDTADEGEAEDMASFWGSTTIATAVSDSYASIQDAYIDGSTLVINGTYDITTDEGDVLDTSDAGEHRFTLSGSAKLGSMGGDGEPETMSVEEFDEILQYDMENNPGLGLVFYVENDQVLEVWITS